MPRSTRLPNDGDTGSLAAPPAEEAGPSRPLSDSEKLDRLLESVSQLNTRVVALEERDVAADDADPTPQLRAQQLTPTADEFVEWKNFYNVIYHVLPLLSMFKPDLFNLHGEETHGLLIEQNKKGSAREYQVLYCSAFHLDAVLAYFASITDGDARTPEMVRVHNSLLWILRMLTARMAVIQVNAATPKGDFTEGYQAYVEQRAYSHLATQNLMNPDHQAWHADYLRIFGEQQIRQIARNAVPQSGARPSRIPSAPPPSRPARRPQPAAPPAAEEH